MYTSMFAFRESSIEIKQDLNSRTRGIEEVDVAEFNIAFDFG